MDSSRFDEFARSFGVGTSRRDLLHGLVGATIGMALSSLPSAIIAKKKRKKKRKKTQPAFNQFGCLDIGQPCRGNAALCCSGICQGKKPKPGEKDKSSCVAHNAGICIPQLDLCTLDQAVDCGPTCFCLLTTGNAGFCADPPGNVELCRICTKDADCQAEFGPGAACIFLGRQCGPLCDDTGFTACVPPCA